MHKKSYLILPFLFALSVIVCLASCSESPKQKKTEIKFDAEIYDENGNLFTGTRKGTVGSKVIEYEVVNGKKHGSFKTYYENGNPEMEGQIKENKNEGLWKYYYENGTLESEGNFQDDRIEGKWYWYYPTGSLREISEYQDGVRNGKIIMYDSTGTVIEEKLYKDGSEVE